MCCLWLVPCSCVTGHVSLTVPFPAALYRTHEFNVMRDGRPPWLSLGTYQPAQVAFPLHLCRVTASCCSVFCSMEDAIGWRKLGFSNAAMQQCSNAAMQQQWTEVRSILHTYTACPGPCLIWVLWVTLKHTSKQHSATACPRVMLPLGNAAPKSCSRPGPVSWGWTSGPTVHPVAGTRQAVGQSCPGL